MQSSTEHAQACQKIELQNQNKTTSRFFRVEEGCLARQKLFIIFVNNVNGHDLIISLSILDFLKDGGVCT